jgi:hypothetical protein
MYFGNEYQIYDLRGDKNLTSTDAKQVVAHIHENFGISGDEFDLFVNGVYADKGFKELILELGLDANKVKYQ